QPLNRHIEYTLRKSEKGRALYRGRLALEHDCDLESRSAISVASLALWPRTRPPARCVPAGLPRIQQIIAMTTLS
ncbi:MAG: hypothetical protein QM608_07690, partial [Caulobacter sp.]